MEHWWNCTIDGVFEYAVTCISSFQFVYRGHVRGSFNLWFQVLWVLCFYPVLAAAILASVYVRGFICVHVAISGDL